MKSIVFEGDTWTEYEKLREKDKRLHKNLCKILQELQRGDGSKGIGKPEPLKHNLAGLWSRRISQKDRLIYSFTDVSLTYICNRRALRRQISSLLRLTKRTLCCTIIVIFRMELKMTRVMSASKARENIFTLIDETAATHQPILITGKRNNVVMISEEDYNAIQETFYLSSNPALKASIIDGLNTPPEECSENIEW